MNNRRKLLLCDWCRCAHGVDFLVPATIADQARVGFITATPKNSDTVIPELRRGLRNIGLIEGQNFSIEYRSAEGQPERVSELAAELVGLKPDVIVTTSLTAEAVKNATKTIPIVFMILDDPVAAKLVSSLARPGGNATGLSSLNTDLDGKRIALLKETFSRLKQVVALTYPHIRGTQAIIDGARKTCRALDLAVEIVPVSNATRLDEVVFPEIKGDITGLAVLGFGYFFFHQEKLAALAARKRMPGITPWKTFTEMGGLMSYGTNSTEMFQRAAVYVDKILKGANPADLPVEQPTKFELVINTKAAKMLGIKIPYSILVRADKVIE